jgi:hypothetical protein
MIEELPHDHPGRKTRACKCCGEIKSPEGFPVHKHKTAYGGYQAFHKCITCEKDRKLRSHLKHTYNLELEDYYQMVVEQDNKCYLCGEEPSDVYGRLVVDHCHKTGKVRKLLCRMCNIHLSKIEACPEYFSRVQDYLK